jgi:hypothetical protein
VPAYCTGPADGSSEEPVSALPVVSANVVPNVVPSVLSVFSPRPTTKSSSVPPPGSDALMAGPVKVDPMVTVSPGCGNAAPLSVVQFDMTNQSEDWLPLGPFQLHVPMAFVLPDSESSAAVAGGRQARAHCLENCYLGQRQGNRVNSREARFRAEASEIQATKGH